jgi:hypothetical protein
VGAVTCVAHWTPVAAKNPSSLAAAQATVGTIVRLQETSMRFISLLALASALSLASANALAADKDVKVINTLANPVPVTVTNSASGTVLPYRSTVSVANSGSCASNQCYFNFAAVPAGKRLVVQNVSGQVATAARTVLFERGQEAFFVGIPSTAQGFFTQPTTMYYEPGEVPSARIFTGELTSASSLIVTVVGMLVPAN